jgi:hypothetical protein
MNQEMNEKIDKIAEKLGIEDKPKQPINEELKAFLFVSLGISISSGLTLLSYYFLLPAFPLALGMVVVFLGLYLWLLSDKYILPGNTIEKLSSDSKAIALFVIAISIFYRTGVEFGNSYLANPYGSNEKISGNSEQIKSFQSAQTPQVSNDGLGSQGEPKREQ